MDRARKEIEFTATERDRIARDGVPNKQKSRWTGEPYQSTEHCLFDYDRRIGHLQECLEQVLAQAESYSGALQSIDAGGGRRTVCQSASCLRAEGVGSVKSLYALLMEKISRDIAISTAVGVTADARRDR